MSFFELFFYTHSEALRRLLTHAPLYPSHRSSFGSECVYGHLRASEQMRRCILIRKIGTECSMSRRY